MLVDDETFKVGDLVEVFSRESTKSGIVLKKRFTHQDVQGQKYNILTYDVLFDNGAIQNFQPQRLKIIQKI